MEKFLNELEENDIVVFALSHGQSAGLNIGLVIYDTPTNTWSIRGVSTRSQLEYGEYVTTLGLRKRSWPDGRVIKIPDSYMEQLKDGNVEEPHIWARDVTSEKMEYLMDQRDKLIAQA